MSEPTKFELAHLPFGFCSACLERMKSGQIFQAQRLVDGAQQISAYCADREIGGVMILRPDRPQRWTLLTPIDAVEWRACLEYRAGLYAGVRDGLMGGPIDPKNIN